MDTPRFELRPAGPDDYESAAALLRQSGLPLEGVRASVEFQSGCPETAVLMHARLERS